jgi:hypothetical protein
MSILCNSVIHRFWLTPDLVSILLGYWHQDTSIKIKCLKLLIKFLCLSLPQVFLFHNWFWFFMGLMFKSCIPFVFHLWVRGQLYSEFILLSFIELIFLNFDAYDEVLYFHGWLHQFVDWLVRRKKKIIG